MPAAQVAISMQCLGFFQPSPLPLLLPLPLPLALMLWVLPQLPGAEAVAALGSLLLGGACSLAGALLWRGGWLRSQGQQLAAARLSAPPCGIARVPRQPCAQLDVQGAPLCLVLADELGSKQQLLPVSRRDADVAMCLNLLQVVLREQAQQVSV